MTKFFKKLCLILAILIIPVSLVACGKDPENPTDTPSGGGSSTPPTTVVFELNEETVNEVIAESIDVFEDAVDALNESDILNVDDDHEGEVLAVGLFRYLYYANEVRKVLPEQKVGLGDVYAYRLGGADNKSYFHVFNDGNDKLYVNYVTYNAGSYEYVGYEILLDNGDIENININYFETKKDYNRVQFYNGKLNISESTFEVYSGETFDGYSRTYLESKLNSENVDSVFWTKTYYDKFEFGSNKSYSHNFNTQISEQIINENIDELEVLKVFEVYDEYNALQDAEIDVILEINYIANIPSSGFNYVYENYKIEKRN